MEKCYTHIQYENKNIYLIGTAHVSKISVQQVRETIEEINPDCICIELDDKRYESLNNPKKWLDTDIIEIIKKKQTTLLLVNTILSSFQKRVAKNLDSKSGMEMIEGINQAKKRNIDLVLADRNIQTTFMRIWRKHSFLQKIKLVCQMITSIFDDEDISEEDLMNLQKSDMLEAALNDIGKNFPVIKTVLVDERDQYLAQKIKQAPGKEVVAILGAAHLGGVSKELFNDHDLNELDHIPEKTLFSKLIGWCIPALIIGIIGYTFFQNRELGINQIQTWILWNGSLSAIGVLLGGGHILSILVAFIAAPITSLNPLLAAGWFAGITEATLRKPAVKDFENINEDISSLKKAYSNRVIRILLIVILANLLSTIGTLIGGADVLHTFFNL
ncbi:MAG: TraB/GumN family protein [Erysipelotrichaceae bacterium]